MSAAIGIKKKMSIKYSSVELNTNQIYLYIRCLLLEETCNHADIILKVNAQICKETCTKLGNLDQAISENDVRLTTLRPSEII